MRNIRPRRPQPRVRRNDAYHIELLAKLSRCTDGELDDIYFAISTFIDEGVITSDLAPWYVTAKEALRAAA